MALEPASLSQAQSVRGLPRREPFPAVEGEADRTGDSGIRLYDDLAVEGARICTLPPSSRSTGGVSTTWAPCLTPSLPSTSVPQSRISVILRLCTAPFSTTST